MEMEVGCRTQLEIRTVVTWKRTHHITVSPMTAMTLTPRWNIVRLSPVNSFMIFLCVVGAPPRRELWVTAEFPPSLQPCQPSIILGQPFVERTITEGT